MRQPKERKLQRTYGAGGGPGGGDGGGGSGRPSRNSSPSASNGVSRNGPASERIKSLDALNLNDASSTPPGFVYRPARVD
ncbi:hypothetical protein ZHAS_00019564 [Anopheles sinensis]|uniref:Uncharacterized protein n=1 Tax=Anopheles sinensis TaxID=74873 RepID=A0A084WMR2_ANOSI|nr:hypothetical protein ZHAS_00019564 [Anopheles sinensis]